MPALRVHILNKQTIGDIHGLKESITLKTMIQLSTNSIVLQELLKTKNHISNTLGNLMLISLLLKTIWKNLKINSIINCLINYMLIEQPGLSIELKIEKMEKALTNINTKKKIQIICEQNMHNSLII